MNESAQNIASAISALASARREEREAAAAVIFDAALHEAEPLARAWGSEPEFARLIGAPAAAFTAGVAVEPELFAAIRSANGSPRLSDVPAEQDVLEFHLNFSLHAGAVARLEILTARDSAGEGAVARYLRKFGRNIQHIEIATSDVDRAIDILRARFALQPIYAQAHPGADGSRINFFLVANPQGKKLLVELEEEAKRS
jgi:hypothetical protein